MRTKFRQFRLSNGRRRGLDGGMPNLHTPEGALFLLQILTSLLLAILFLQSGIDKVVDRRGNLEWLTGHFAKSPLAAGILSAVGCVFMVLRHDSTWAFYGAVISAISLVALFLGQRMAKDYAGAATLVPYFLLSCAAIYWLG
jgi:diacylglycerol kinase